jgi:hypothetical protein
MDRSEQIELPIMEPKEQKQIVIKKTKDGINSIVNQLENIRLESIKDETHK